MALPDLGGQHDPEVWKLLAWRHDSRTYLYFGADRGLVCAGNHGQTFAGVKNAGSAHTLNVVSGTVLTSLTSAGGYISSLRLQSKPRPLPKTRLFALFMPHVRETEPIWLFKSC